MNPAPITGWLRTWVRSQVVLNLAGGVAVLLLGALLLLLTWAMVYLVSIFALGPWLGYHHWCHSVAGLVLIPLLFWGNARTSREYLSEYSVIVGTSSETVVNFYLPGVGLVSNVNPLAPATIHAGAKMITDCLYVGPRAVVKAFHMFSHAMKLRRMDLDGCGAVLTVLFSVQRKLSFQEIVASVDWMNPAVVFPQLHWVDGVIFLAAEPAGLTLSQEFRQTLRPLISAALQSQDAARQS
jgi:hypothetical protein